MKSSHVIILVVVLILLAVLIFTAKDKDQDINVNESGSNLEEVSNTPTGADPDNTQAQNTNTNAGVSAGVTVVPPVKEFTVTGTNFEYSPSTITVNKGDRVKIIFKNTQGFHDFVIDGYGVATAQLRAPKEEILEFTADKTGSFEYYCSVGTHRQQGMIGTLNVK